MKILKIIMMVVIPLLMSGCVAVLVGGGAAAGGYAVAKDKGPVGQYTSDSLITSKVKTKFLADSHLKSYNISVTTNEQVVTLTGTVPTTEMRVLAIDIVRHTKDVKGVNVTNFKVSSNRHS